MLAANSIFKLKNENSLGLILWGTKRGVKVFGSYNLEHSNEELDRLLPDLRNNVNISATDEDFISLLHYEEITVYSHAKTILDWGTRLGFFAASIVVPSQVDLEASHIGQLALDLVHLYKKSYIDRGQTKHQIRQDVKEDFKTFNEIVSRHDLEKIDFFRPRRSIKPLTVQMVLDEPVSTGLDEDAFIQLERFQEVIVRFHGQKSIASNLQEVDLDATRIKRVHLSSSNLQQEDDFQFKIEVNKEAYKREVKGSELNKGLLMVLMKEDRASITVRTEGKTFSITSDELKTFFQSDVSYLEKDVKFEQPYRKQRTAPSAVTALEPKEETNIEVAHHDEKDREPQSLLSKSDPADNINSGRKKTNRTKSSYDATPNDISDNEPPQNIIKRQINKKVLIAAIVVALLLMGIGGWWLAKSSDSSGKNDSEVPKESDNQKGSNKKSDVDDYFSQLTEAMESGDTIGFKSAYNSIKSADDFNKRKADLILISDALQGKAKRAINVDHGSDEGIPSLIAMLNEFDADEKLKCVLKVLQDVHVYKILKLKIRQACQEPDGLNGKMTKYQKRFEGVIPLGSCWKMYKKTDGNNLIDSLTYMDLLLDAANYEWHETRITDCESLKNAIDEKPFWNQADGGAYSDDATKLGRIKDRIKALIPKQQNE